MQQVSALDTRYLFLNLYYLSGMLSLETFKLSFKTDFSKLWNSILNLLLKFYYL